MADINLNNLDGIPFGIDSGRPSNPQPGQPYFNGQSNRLEIYTQTVGWQNIVQETPAVVNVVGSAKESTSSTITINGTNFAVGCLAYAVGTNGTEYQATTTSLVSVVQLTATFPALSLSYEPYDIKVVNPSNLYGVLYDCLNVDAKPVWTTGSGSLGTYVEQSAMSVQVTATDASDPESSALIYSISSGALPSGLSINSSTGVISGTPANISSPTTYSFTASAYDGFNPAVTRNFSITISDRGPTWVTSATLPSFTKNVAYSTTLSATDEDNVATISYSLFSGSLPTGLSLNSSTGVISGTPTVSVPYTFTIRATDSISSSYSDRQFTLPNAGPVWTSGSSLDTAYQGGAYSYQVLASDDSGSTPTYAFVSGSLPTGLSFNASTGIISGTPTTIQTSNFVLSATDGNGVSTNLSTSITVSYPVVSGGTLTSDSTYYYRTFTGSGTLSVLGAAITADILVVGGGGSGGNHHGGGGGAGGVLYKTNHSISANPSISIQVGGGGAADSSGTDSWIGDTNGPKGFGGGRGGREWNINPGCENGGSGGGAGGNGGTAQGTKTGASAIQTSNNGGTGYGNNGGNGGGSSSGIGGGGGGGAGGAGSSGPSGNGGTGGNGITLMGISVAAGGAGSSSDSGNVGSTWGNGISATTYGGSAPANTGSGGNAGGGSGLGGSGKVVIRYTKTQVGG